MSTAIRATPAADLDGLLAVLARVDRDVSDAERIDQLTALERVKAACAAAQVRITADFAVSQQEVADDWRKRARERSAAGDFEGWVAAREQARRAAIAEGSGGGERRDGRGSRRLTRGDVGVAGQIALARRESPSRGSRHLTMALALVRRLPHTLSALEAGELSEWRAEIVVRELAMLADDVQTVAEAELFDQLGVDGVARLGDRELIRRLQAIAYRLDAESVVKRCRGAERERRVSLRPAPDTMSYLSAYLPVAQGVAVHAALTAAAASARAAGDQRSKGQLMADLLVQRVTGQQTAEAVPVEVQVVITDRALFSAALGVADQAPAHVPGYGTVPAAWARELLLKGPERAWLRRLYTHPADGTLVAMDSKRRTFDGGLRRFLVARDGLCTTPWCDAPIRHLDHAVPHASRGPTDAHNGNGKCERCNHIKEFPGWRTTPDPVAPPGKWRPHGIVITTPTGHRYASAAPPVLPGVDAEASVLERHLETLLAA